MDNENRSCIDCGSAACRGKGGQFPPFCRTEHLDEALLDRSLEILKGEENAFSVAAAVNERDGYGTKSRIEETMHFAQLLGVKKIGIATCAGLIHEANALARVLRAQGVRVAAVFTGENTSVPAANTIYGRDLARIRRMDQLAAAAGRLIQDEIRELSG